MTGFGIGKNGEDNKTTAFGIAPEVGYFVSDKFSVGLGVFYNYSKTEIGSSETEKGTYGVNPYARYYVCGAEKFNFYVQGGLDFAVNNPAGEKSSTYWAAGVNPGVSYALSNKFTLTAAFGFLGYQRFGEKVNNFGLDLDLNSLKLGLNIKF